MLPVYMRMSILFNFIQFDSVLFSNILQHSAAVFPLLIFVPERTPATVSAFTRRPARPSHVTTPHHACAKK